MNDHLQFRQSSGTVARKIGNNLFSEAGQDATWAEFDEMVDS
jgi:hypothetical protein